MSSYRTTTLCMLSLFAYMNTGHTEILVANPITKSSVKADPLKLNDVLTKEYNEARVRIVGQSQQLVKDIKNCGKKVRCLMKTATEYKANYLLHTMVAKKNQNFIAQIVLLKVGEKKPLEKTRYTSDGKETIEVTVAKAAKQMIPLLEKRELVRPPPPQKIAASSPAPSPGSDVEPTVTGKIMVLDLRAVSVKQQDADVLTHQAGVILGQRAELKVITKAEIKEALKLEKTKQMMGCTADQECLAQIRNAADADFVVSGSLGKIGDSLILTLSLVNTESTETVGQVNQTQSKISELSQSLPNMLAELFQWKGESTKPKFKLPEGQELTFAILDLQATGVSKEVAANLTQVLSSEIKKVDGTKVIGREDLMAILSTEKLAQMLGAACDTSCVAELGGALGADKLVTGQVGKVGDKYIVSMRLINPIEISVDSRSTESYEGEEKLLIRATRAAARKLIGVESDIAGTLVVSASENGSEIFVNNKKVGEHPLPPISGLKPGRHSLRIVSDGYYEWRSDTYVDSGEDTAMWAQLTPTPQQWYQKWWVWTIVGVAAAGGGTAAVLASQADPTAGTGSISIE